MEEAVIYSFTEVFSTSEAFQNRIPYIVAIIERVGGERFPAFIEGNGASIAIGKTASFSHIDDGGKPVYMVR